MASIGMGEIVVLAVIWIWILFYFIPVAAVVWIIIAIKRLRKGQEEIRNKLEAVEQFLIKKE